MFPKLFFIFDRPNNHANIFGKNSLPHKKLKIKEVNLFFKKNKITNQNSGSCLYAQN